MFAHYLDKGLIQTHLQWQAVKLGSSSGLLWHVSLWNFTYISQDSQEVHCAVSKIFFWVGGGLHLSWFIQQDMIKHGVTIKLGLMHKTSQNQTHDDSNFGEIFEAL